MTLSPAEGYSDQRGGLQPVLIVRDGKVVADSRDVAAYFRKRHDNVLQDIDKLLKELGEGGLLNFQDIPYVHPQNGQTYRRYEMTRDGFTLLAMGFKGKKALGFKIKYVAQFNWMEAEIARQSQPLSLPAFDVTDSDLVLRIITAQTTKAIAEGKRADAEALRADANVVSVCQRAYRQVAAVAIVL